MTDSKKRALVLGRQIFVDLWALEGFEKMLCEDPSDFPALMKDLVYEDIGFILVEESWLKGLSDLTRNKLEKLQEPVVVAFPSITSDLI